MIRKVVSYFNKQEELKFYESIKLVENQDNAQIIGSCRRYLHMAPQNEIISCVGKEIRIIGEFDDENISCPLVSYETPILIVDCDEILKTRFPQLYEQAN